MRSARFYELRERIEGVSEKMLSQTLCTLVRDGLLWRAVEPSTAPRVTYGLTPLGRGTSEHLAGVFGWIREHRRPCSTGTAGPNPARNLDVMALFGRDKSQMITADRALPGRATPLRVPAEHFVNGRRIQPPFPDGAATAVFGMGCFWGAERIFWQTPGVYSTAVGYAGGFTENPTYEETCSGLTGHAEVVLVVFDPAQISYETLLRLFWEGHNPTQGMRQGNDRGTQYRSAVYYTDDAQRELAESTAKTYGDALRASRHGEITTEIAPLRHFYYAEDYHQQYLAKVPDGYCGIGGTGVSCPVGTGVQSDQG